MPSTKKEALKERSRFLKKYPELQTIIIDNTDKFPRGDGLRYNFRFLKKKTKLRKKIYTEKEADKLMIKINRQT